MHDDLWEAVRSGLIFRADDSYRFLHDRVQEAAYSLIPKEQRAEAHLRIGMLLAAHTPAGETRRSHLRDRQSAQSRLAPHRLGRRARAGRRPEPDRGQAREDRDRLRLRTQVPQGRQRSPDGGRLGAQLRARVLDRVPDGRVRAADGETCRRPKSGSRGWPNAPGAVMTTAS